MNLMHIGRPMDPQLSQSLARIAVSLSRRALGACIVVSGVDDVEPHLHHESLSWTAPLFDGLLEALFASHDTNIGAIVLDATGENVTHRQAFLPYLKRESNVVPSPWGSRHITALTLTERCDAVALVVSEQTGDVTVFEAGAWRTSPRPQFGDQGAWMIMQAEVGRLLSPSQLSP